MKKFDIACLIDDDSVFVIMAERMIKIADFCNHLLVFRNGKEALDNLISLLKEGKSLPDVIFLDLNMPVLDGWQFLDEFSKIPTQKKTHIYILTSSIDPEDIKRVNTYDAVYDYLQKPLTIAKFKEIMKDFEDN